MGGVIIIVTRESEDRLERQLWRWRVEAGFEIRVVLRQYAVERRQTRRHRKWQLVEWWVQSSPGRFGRFSLSGGVELLHQDVPVPDDVREEARAFVVAAIRMEV